MKLSSAYWPAREPYFLFTIGFPAFLGMALVFPSSSCSLSSSWVSPLSLNQRISVLMSFYHSVNLAFWLVNSTHWGLKDYLRCCRSEQVSPSQVKITDGCHGDSVVGVIVLYRLCCTGNCIFQIVLFKLLWGMNWQTNDWSEFPRETNWFIWTHLNFSLTESVCPLLQHLHVFLVPLKPDSQI